MRPFTFHPGPRLIAGEALHNRLAELLPEGPCLLVTDAGVRGLGLADPFCQALDDAGSPVTVFDQVEADPSKESLLAAMQSGREAGAVSVVGLGGGSPMDVAKLAAYLLGSGDELDDIWGVDLAKGERLPLVLVPTTAGTGSEATPISVITCQGGVKLAVNSRPLTADWALLDPGLTIGLPVHVTAATGIDAIVHAVEAYTSARLKNPLSDALAREALRLLSGNLLAACREPGNLDARSAMLLGAHLAGVAFANAPVGGVHALAYPLGGLFHLPHGLTNALMLRPVLEHNAEAARELYAELAPILDPASEHLGTQARAQGFINQVCQLAADTGVSLRLRDHNVGADALDRLASEAMKQTRLLVNNPCPIEEADARRLYEAAW
jgi:alcohol dehydrogenase class IV